MFDYSNHESRIKFLAYKWAPIIASPVYDRDELFAEGCLVFAECVKSFASRPDITFGTYLQTCIENRFRTFYLKSHRHPSINFADYNQEMDYLDANPGSMPPIPSLRHNAEGYVSLKETIELLPESAKETLKALLKYNGLLGARNSRWMRAVGKRKPCNMTCAEVVNFTGKNLEVVEEDMKIIKFFLSQ